MPIGPIQDPYRIAAKHCLEGDYTAALSAIRETWIESIIDGFEPDVDADEDGEYSDPQGELRREAAGELDGYLDQMIGDAAYELAGVEMGEDEAVELAAEVTNRVKAEFAKHVDDIASDAYDQWSDGQSYNRDPYAYHGVKRSDF